MPVKGKSIFRTAPGARLFSICHFSFAIGASTVFPLPLQSEGEGLAAMAKLYFFHFSSSGHTSTAEERRRVLFAAQPSP